MVTAKSRHMHFGYKIICVVILLCQFNQLIESLIAGEVTFSAGCIDRQKCTSASRRLRMSALSKRQAITTTVASPAQVTCNECCLTDLCNTGHTCFQAKISPTVATGLVYGSIHFRCSFDLPISGMNITWYRDGHLLDLGQYPRVTARGVELTLFTIDRLDSGQYSCEVLHDKKTYRSNEASLVVAGGPEVKPSSWIVPTTGRTVEISCDVTGATTNHNFVWSREDGSPLDDHILSTRIDTAISTKLSFSFDGIDQSGVYVCRDIGSLDFQPYEKVGVMYQVGALACATNFSACPNNRVGSLCGGKCPAQCGFDGNVSLSQDSGVCEQAGPIIDQRGGFVVWTYVYHNATRFVSGCSLVSGIDISCHNVDSSGVPSSVWLVLALYVYPILLGLY